MAKRSPEDEIDLLIDNLVDNARKGADNATERIIKLLDKYLTVSSCLMEHSFYLSKTADFSLVWTPKSPKQSTQVPTHPACPISSEACPKLND